MHLEHDYTPGCRVESFAEGMKYTVSDSIPGQAEGVLHWRYSDLQLGWRSNGGHGREGCWWKFWKKHLPSWTRKPRRAFRERLQAFRHPETWLVMSVYFTVYCGLCSGRCWVRSLRGWRRLHKRAPVDSAVVNALQRGQGSSGDLLSSPYHSLQAFAVQSTIVKNDRQNDMMFNSTLHFTKNKKFT